jgi:hypothetical protein
MAWLPNPVDGWLDNPKSTAFHGDIGGRGAPSGEDEYGRWLGTEHDPFPIYPDVGRPLTSAEQRLPKRFYVEAFWGSEPFHSYARARSAEDVRRYFTNMGLRDIRVQEDKGPARR